METSPITVVLKVDVDCKRCLRKIVRSARGFEGVETVRADPVSNELNLIGFMDPVKITEKLQKESKMKIELVSPNPEKETRVNHETEPTNVTMVAVTTVILKLNCSCDGCVKRIRKTASNTKGVYQVKIDKETETVTVMGTMQVKAVTDNLKRELKKTLEVLA